MHSEGMFEDDGAAASASWRWLVNNISTAWMRKYSPMGALVHDFYLNSFLSNGFRITYNAVNDANPYIYNYLVMWGSDISVNSGFWVARTTAGADTIAHGLAGAPNFVMLLCPGIQNDNNNASHGQLAIGMASSTAAANQKMIAINVRNAQPTMDNYRYMPTGNALGVLVGGAVDALGSITALGATSFNFTWSNPPSLAYRIPWLAIRGGRHDVHEILAPVTAPGNQTKTGLSFQPQGLFGFSRGSAANTTSDAHASITVGATKSSSIQRAASYVSEDATANSEAAVMSTNQYFIHALNTAVDPTAASTASPVVQAKLSSFASGGYTLTFDSTNKTGVYYPNYGGGSQQSQIETAMTAHPSLPFIICINPCPQSGISSGDANWQRIQAYKLHPNCFKVIGYLPTNYGTLTANQSSCDPTPAQGLRTLAAMKIRVDLYKTHYPNLDGLMYDETSNSTSATIVAFYQAICDYARDPNSTPAAPGVTLNWIKSNPGTSSPAAHDAMMDNQCIIERSIDQQGYPPLALVQANTSRQPKDEWTLVFHHTTATGLNASALNSYKPYVKFITWTDIEYTDVPASFPSFCNILDYGTP